MTQKLKTIIFATALTALAACSDDVATGRYSVGEEDNLVRLTTGVENAPSAAMQSRAAVSEATHYALQTGTALNLYVEGKWTKAYGTTNDITKTPIYKADDPSGNFINPVQYDATYNSTKSTLYWDDFGTADPANTANRAKGLGILAVAVDGKVLKTSNIKWESYTLAWNVATSSTVQPSGSSQKFLLEDLLVANNLYAAIDAESATTPQKRYTFGEQKALDTNPAEARLEFQHVLSKITFNVKAGEGFEGSGGKKTFYTSPIVTLARNKSNEADEPWCLTNGSIDIKQAKAESDGTMTVVELSDMNNDLSNVTEAAVIYPGSILGSTDDIVARIHIVHIDGANVYYVTAAKIREAIDKVAEHSGNYATKPGYNYIFNITVNKTGIVVTATVSKWIDVNAAEEAPQIVVSANVGDMGATDQTLQDFRFYRNEGVNVPLIGMGDAPTAPTTKNVKYTALADAKNPATGSVADGATAWKFWTIAETPTETSLYWPNHTTHYFFRGVYPSATNVTDGGGTSSYIAVNNAKYEAATFPSNLMIGAPEITDGTNCNNPDHAPVDMSKYGICARTGSINLNFRYMMSQVEVDLKTETSSDDKVELNADTKLEILNPITQSNIYLGTRSTGYEASTVRATDYTMHRKGDATASLVTFHDAIVPQYLPKPNEDKPMRFKVTIKNSNGTYDVYYADVQPIQVSESGGAKKTIENWLGGYHYKYTLTLKKTGISVTATITDWIPANGSDNVWM
ncbi:MAG: fimbrillin family protein [Muribaculaceae bacterium]